MPERSQVTTPKRRWITSTYGETLRREKIIKRPVYPDPHLTPPQPRERSEKKILVEFFSKN